MTWVERGLCVGQNPLWWDSDWLIANSAGGTEDDRRRAASATARRLCDGCPVWTECRDDAAEKIDIAEPFNRCAAVFNESGLGAYAGETVRPEPVWLADVSSVVRAGYLL